MPNILPLRVLIAKGQPTLDGRIEATLRIRWPSAKFSYVATGPAVVDIVGHVDFDRSRAWVDRVPVHLTPLELRLLAQLVGHGGNVVSDRALLAPILGKANNDATDCLWIYVRRLREKIEPDPNVPRYVLTERG